MLGVSSHSHRRPNRARLFPIGMLTIFGGEDAHEKRLTLTVLMIGVVPLPEYGFRAESALVNRLYSPGLEGVPSRIFV